MRTLVAADLRLFRELLAQGLSGGSLDLVGAASGASELLDFADAFEPDLVVVDMAMEESGRAVGQLLQNHPEVRVVALGLADDERDLIECAKAGVCSYVARDASLDDLRRAVRRTAAGAAILPPRIAATLLQRLATVASGRLPARDDSRLTPREFEIVCLIEQGCSNKGIAQQLSIALSTVKNHVHSIFEKLHVSRRSDAAAWVNGTRASGLGAAQRGAERSR